MPAKSWPANHADGRRNNDRTGRNDDFASVRIATAIPATMFATTAAIRGLGTEACKAQHGGEC
jgi:hypothetical protein